MRYQPLRERSPRLLGLLSWRKSKEPKQTGLHTGPVKAGEPPERSGHAVPVKHPTELRGEKKGSVLNWHRWLPKLWAALLPFSWRPRRWTP